MATRLIFIILHNSHFKEQIWGKMSEVARNLEKGDITEAALGEIFAILQWALTQQVQSQLSLMVKWVCTCDFKKCTI
jgi:hypothetical protein